MKRKIDKARRTLIVSSSFGDREKRRFEVLQKGISSSPVSFWPTSDTEIEDEIESTCVSSAKKRKNRFRDTGAESRKKRLLCQRSTEKYRDLEEEIKSYIQSMFNSSFTALGLEDADLSDVFDSLFSTLDVNVGTQEHLQKTMGNLTQESNVDSFDPSKDNQSEGPSAFTTPMTSFRPEIFKTPFLIDSDNLEVCCKAKDYELVFLPEDKWAKLIEWILNPTVLWAIYI
ncbi:hypothetical protein HID58_085760 [Brassica napus]|uniref:Ovate family protein n=1 Tax=Brassica napus TaxID=3708 RepID=A0ABQ7XNI7_BRANA|nr:hypothetical protein HID58_085760 [Brassica napus]